MSFWGTAVLGVILTLFGISMNNAMYEMLKAKVEIGPNDVKWYYRFFLLDFTR